MEGDNKNWWAANYCKPEIWPGEPESLRTSALPSKWYDVMNREVFNDPIIILILNQTLLLTSTVTDQH